MVRVVVRDADTGSIVEMDLEDSNTIDEMIESAAAHWNKDLGAYVLRYGSTVLRGPIAVSQSPFKDGDVLELIPDPEGGIKNA